MTKSEKNKFLIELFPFLQAPVDGKWDYSWTFIDFVPLRHRTRFMNMCWELKKVKQDFHIIDVKEKYDEMRIYIDTANEEAQNIINSYWKGVKYYD